MAYFKDIVGQEQMKEHMQGAIEQKKISHAYIINGENRSGKEFIAKIFSQAILCEQGGKEPCGQCHSCIQAESRNHPDIIFVSHEKPNVIGVDDIRDGINNTVMIKPYSSPYKIYIVQEAEKMTPQAQNALLKTLEEPPAYAVFILLVNTMESMLPTIVSRCVVLNMKPVRDEEMRRYLMKELQVPDYRAEICIAFARGNVGRAKALASSEDFDKIRTEALSLLKNIYDMEIAEIVDSLKQIKEYGFDINDYLDIMAVWYRDVLLFKATHDLNHLIFRDEIQHIKKVAQRSDYEGIEEVINALEKAKNRLNSKVNFELTMELLLLTLKEN
ncbi:MAG: DNA polymerase III subunit delta' [Lachnospiraceae bacterium]|nr:DNA polymerase III subunit delta' [Lachnospiraceae bacterium]MBQ8262753.1 DNA polymerase III subunit delta' [Lachnospiraceae bacterium]MBQ8263112.1 DNA polymerase III subunit delta' [Lachnospiraceae bacterium]